MTSFPRVSTVEEGIALMRTVARINRAILGRVADRYDVMRTVAFVVWRDQQPTVGPPIFIVRGRHFVVDPDPWRALDVLVGKGATIYDFDGARLSRDVYDRALGAALAAITRQTFVPVMDILGAITPMLIKPVAQALAAMATPPDRPPADQPVPPRGSSSP